MSLKPVLKSAHDMKTHTRLILDKLHDLERPQKCHHIYGSPVAAKDFAVVALLKQMATLFARVFGGSTDGRLRDLVLKFTRSLSFVGGLVNELVPLGKALPKYRVLGPLLGQHTKIFRLIDAHEISVPMDCLKEWNDTLLIFWGYALDSTTHYILWLSKSGELPRI